MSIQTNNVMEELIDLEELKDFDLETNDSSENQTGAEAGCLSCS